MVTVAFCEIEDYPVSILNKHWPDVPVHKDIRKLDAKKYRGSIELICGGFPCQPFSVAGKQTGEADDRHLWPEMFRVIQEVRPAWVIGENVAGFITMALDDVLSDLEGEGYTCQTFVIPACAVGGIHRRDRVWIVAHTDRQGESGRAIDDPKERIITDSEQLSNIEQSRGSMQRGWAREGKQTGMGGKQTSANPDLFARVESPATETQKYRKPKRKTRGRGGFDAGFRPIPIPTESPIRSRDDGLPDNMARLKAMGNAVVPQIPELIGRAIMAAA